MNSNLFFMSAYQIVTSLYEMQQFLIFFLRGEGCFNLIIIFHANHLSKIFIHYSAHYAEKKKKTRVIIRPGDINNLQ